MDGRNVLYKRTSENIQDERWYSCIHDARIVSRLNKQNCRLTDCKKPMKGRRRSSKKLYMLKAWEEEEEKEEEEEEDGEKDEWGGGGVGGGAITSSEKTRGFLDLKFSIPTVQTGKIKLVTSLRLSQGYKRENFYSLHGGIKNSVLRDLLNSPPITRSSRKWSKSWKEWIASWRTGW